MPIDLSPAAVDRRLRQASRLAEPLLRAQQGQREVRRVVRRAAIDMSPGAIDRRLQEVSDLRDLCLELGRLRG